MHLLQFFFLLSGIPAAEPVKFDAENVKDLACNMIGHVLNGFREIVIGLHGRHNNCAHLGQSEHVPQMNGVERGLSCHKHQFPPLF